MNNKATMPVLDYSFGAVCLLMHEEQGYEANFG